MFNTKGWFNGITKGHFSHCACPSLPAPCPSLRSSLSSFSQGKHVSSLESLGVGGKCGGGDLIPRHKWKPTILHFPMVDSIRRKLYSWFLLKNILYIYMYICVCMYEHMYVYAHVHVYMYISIPDINISYVRVVNTPWSYVCLPHGLISSMLC